MLKSSRVPLCILLLVLTLTISSAQDRAFLFPTGGSNLVTVLDAADLSEQGTIMATATVPTSLPRRVETATTSSAQPKRTPSS